MANPSLYYLVRPKCGSNLTLSVDLNQPQGKLIVSAIKPGANDEQLWQIVTIVTPSQVFTSVLVNKLSGLVAYAPQGNSNVIQIDLKTVISGQVDVSRCAFNLMGGVTSGSYGAFQLSGDTDQNLNVSGDGPYNPGTPVLVWTWSGGDQNEIWECSPVLA